jgi:hypothetical protein
MSTTNYADDIDIELRLMAIECCSCGVPFGIGAHFQKARRADQRTFFCPNGHSNYYPAPKRTEADRLRDQLDAARSLAQRERERRETAERQRSAARGQVTRIKRRVANGVCPCCNRSFADLRRHMTGQHPDYVAEVDQ